MTMSIPESQLQTWGNPGATATPQKAYAAIKSALESAQSPLADKGKEVFLQGSYRNATNIYADSDVDVVIQLNKTFQRDLSELSPAEKQTYLNSYESAEYLEAQFKSDVQTALEARFGKASVTAGKKVFIVKTGISNFTADVLPALQYRKYHWFRWIGNESYTEGLYFHDSSGNVIINYPKQHIENGQKKNAIERTNGWYKTAIRLFKNARNACVERSLLVDGTAPSYFLESLLYNAPDDSFGASYQATFFNVVKALLNLQLRNCLCQNEQVMLFGITSVQWNEADANSTLRALVELWDNW